MLPQRDSWHYIARRWCDRVCHMLVHVLLIAITYALLLFLLRAAWALYTETVVGYTFISNNPETAWHVESFLSFDPLYGTLRVILTAFPLCLLWGIPLRLFWLLRPLFENQGVVMRSLLCGIPLCILTTENLISPVGASSRATFFFALLPCMALVHPGLKILCQIFPEIDDIYRFGKKLLTPPPQ